MKSCWKRIFYGSLLLPLLLRADVQHIVVFTDGATLITRLDSIATDSAYYTPPQPGARQVLDLEKIYYIYNDFGKVFYFSRSFRERLGRLEEQGGVFITFQGDTLSYDRIHFEPTLDNPRAFLYTTGREYPRIVPLLDCIIIRMDATVMENSVRKGVWSSLGLITLNTALQGLVNAKKMLPNTGPQYQSVTLLFPLANLGWMAYDLFTDQRTHYFRPRHQADRYPRNMYLFSIPYWLKRKLNPYWEPVRDSRIYRFIARKKRK